MSTPRQRQNSERELKQPMGLGFESDPLFNHLTQREIRTMNGIYDTETGDTLTVGMRSAVDALRIARDMAAERQEPVIIEYDGTTSIVHPDGDRESYVWPDITPNREMRR